MNANHPPAQRDADAVDAGEYLRVLRRRWITIVVVMLLVTGLAAGYSLTRPPVYEATARVLVRPGTADPLTSGQSSARDIVLPTEQALVHSVGTARAARDLMGSDRTPEGLLERLEVSVPTESQILDITFRGDSAVEAREGATAFARAYLQFRGRQTTSALQATTEELQGRVAGLRQQLAEANATVAASDPDSAERANATVQQSILSNQIAMLETQLGERAILDVDPGAVVGPARLPAAPASPNPPRDIVLGLLAGMILGVIAAFLRDRTDGRVATAEDVERHLAPVLGAVAVSARLPLARTVPGLETLTEPSSDRADAYRRLALIVRGRAARAATERAQQAPLPPVVFVAGPSPGQSAHRVAANLSVALSQLGPDVLLIETNPEAAEDEALPGSSVEALIDVLAGRAPAPSAGAHPEAPALHVLPGPDRGDTAGVRRMLRRLVQTDLRAELTDVADLIVISGPPMLALAETLEVAGQADQVLVVVEQGATTHGELDELALQARRLDLAIDGTVLTARRAAWKRRRGHLQPAPGRLETALVTRPPADQPSHEPTHPVVR